MNQMPQMMIRPGREGVEEARQPTAETERIDLRKPKMNSMIVWKEKKKEGIGFLEYEWVEYD